MRQCKDCLYHEMCYHTHSSASPVCEDFKDKGRFLELPCKVGDFVWFIGYEMSECSCCGASYDEYLCSGCEADCDSEEVWSVSMTRAESIKWLLARLDKFGSVYFLTKEEAEKALAERSCNNG